MMFTRFNCSIYCCFKWRENLQAMTMHPLPLDLTNYDYLFARRAIKVHHVHWDEALKGIFNRGSLSWILSVESITVSRFWFQVTLGWFWGKGLQGGKGWTETADMADWQRRRRRGGHWQLHWSTAGWLLVYDHWLSNTCYDWRGSHRWQGLIVFLYHISYHEGYMRRQLQPMTKIFPFLRPWIFPWEATLSSRSTPTLTDLIHIVINIEHHAVL